MRPLKPYVYADLTWPEITEAVSDARVVVLPVGTTEQHGHHLPLEVDTVTPNDICLEAGRRAPDAMVVMPPVPYGYTDHVMDFPGTITIGWETFVKYLLDVTSSVARHGFKRIVIVNGHGSNDHLVELVGRQTNLLTDATCATVSWWKLVTDEFAKVRTSSFPGGCAHACELETSMLLHIRPESVRTELIADERASYNEPRNDFQWTDLLGSGPVTVNEWTSTYSTTGTIGDPSHATAEKGELVFETAVEKLVGLVHWLRARPDQERAPVRHPDPAPSAQR